MTVSNHTQVAPTRNPFTLENLTAFAQSGIIFSVTFIKRTTGEARTMVCRTGVTKGLKGGTRKYDPAQKGLLPVFDMQAKGYRSIPVDAIQSLKAFGQTFTAGGAA